MINLKKIPNQTILRGLVIYIICFVILILLDVKRFNTFILDQDIPQVQTITDSLSWLAENSGLQTLSQAEQQFINQFLPASPPLIDEHAASSAKQAKTTSLAQSEPITQSVTQSKSIVQSEFATQPESATQTESITQPKPVEPEPTPETLTQPTESTSPQTPADTIQQALVDLQTEKTHPLKVIPDLTLQTTPDPQTNLDSELPKILIIGDSMIMEGFGPVLYRTLKANKNWHVIKEGKYSTGLSRTDYFDWPTHLKQLMAIHKPDLVIICLGANDPQDIMDLQKKRHHADSQSWQEIYQSRAENLLQIAMPAKVVWVGLPIMDREPYATRIKRLSKLQAAACAKFDNAQFLDTTPVLADGQGNFMSFTTDTQGKQIRLRYKDRIHVTEPAGKMLTNFILPTIQTFAVKIAR